MSRDDPHIELHEGDETFDPDDARTMSPRRTSEDLEKMGQDARRQLSQSVALLPSWLMMLSSQVNGPPSKTSC